MSEYFSRWFDSTSLSSWIASGIHALDSDTLLLPGGFATIESKFPVEKLNGEPNRLAARPEVGLVLPGFRWRHSSPMASKVADSIDRTWCCSSFGSCSSACDERKLNWESCLFAELSDPHPCALPLSPRPWPSLFPGRMATENALPFPVEEKHWCVWHSGNTHLNSFQLVSARRHVHVNSVNVEIKLHL